jgi:hypothetical protein
VAPYEVEPGAKRNLLESLGVALLLGIIAPLLIVYGKDGTWTEGLVIGGGTALAAFVFYVIRFMRKGIKRLRLHDEGLDATMRSGQQLRLVWARIKEATLTDDYGGMWHIKFGGGEFELRDDGFSIEEWEEITARIRYEMDRVGKETETDGIHSWTHPEEEGGPLTPEDPDWGGEDWGEV